MSVPSKAGQGNGENVMLKVSLAAIGALSICGVVYGDTIPQSTLMATPNTTNYAYPGTIVSFSAIAPIYGLDSGNNDWDGLHIGAFSSNSVTFLFSQPVTSFEFDFTAHSFSSGSYEERFSNLLPTTWSLSNNSVPGHETQVVGNEVVPLIDDGWGTVSFTGAPFNAASLDLTYILGQPAGTVFTELRYNTVVPEPTTLALSASALVMLRRRR